MQLLRCTRKLQNAIGVSKVGLSDEDPSPSLLGGWHANLIDLGGDTCVIFVNDQTFINFFVDVHSTITVASLKSLFSLGLSCHLSELETPSECKAKMLDEYDEIGFANCNSRKIVGTMNQLTFEYDFMIFETGGFHSPAIPKIIQQMNRTPMKQLGWNYPVEAFQELCQQQL